MRREQSDEGTGPIFAKRVVELSQEEKNRLYKKARSKNIVVRNRAFEALAFAHIGLVITVAKRWRFTGITAQIASVCTNILMTKNSLKKRSL